MSNYVPKIAASRFGAVLKGAQPNIQRSVVEIVFLSPGTEYKNFKGEYAVTGARNEREFTDSLKDAIAADLLARFPSENWRARDILLYGF